MNAVEILTSARDRFARNRRNWIAGALAAKRSDAEDGQCFCSVGGVLKAGGGLTINRWGDVQSLTGVLATKVKDQQPDGYWKDDTFKAYSELSGNLCDGLAYAPVTLDKTLSATIKQLNKLGFKAKPTVTALIRAAARKLSGLEIISFNDRSEDQQTYQEVLGMFDLAIRNAKRRHVNGGTYSANNSRNTRGTVAL